MSTFATVYLNYHTSAYQAERWRTRLYSQIRGRSQRSRPPCCKLTPRPREPPSYGYVRRMVMRNLAPVLGGPTDLVWTMGNWELQQIAVTERGGWSSAAASVQDEWKCWTSNRGQSQSPPECPSRVRRRCEHPESTH